MRVVEGLPAVHSAVHDRVHSSRVVEDHWGAHWYAMYTSCGVSRPTSALLSSRYSSFISSSAVISLGAATLADIYEPSQRGTMMGLYYR